MDRRRRYPMLRSAIIGLWMVVVSPVVGQYGIRGWIVGNGGGHVDGGGYRVISAIGESAVGQSGNVKGGLLRSHRWIQVVQPNGNELWSTETSHTIRWTWLGSVPKVRIEVSNDGGQNWQLVTSGIVNTGSYEWQPAGWISTQAMVRVVAQRADVIQDQSDRVFAVVTSGIQILQPSFAQVYWGSSSGTIQWQWIGSIGYVDLYYRRNAQSAWQLVTSGIANVGQYQWAVPDEPTVEAQVVVRWSNNPQIEDRSEIFEIRSTTQTAFWIGARLEGPYNSSSGNMRIDLFQQGYLPVDQPYTSVGYSGTEQRASWVDNIVDWVLIEFRSSTNTQQVIGRTVGLMLSDGQIVDESGYPQVLTDAVNPGHYYLVLRHRNHLAVMSSSAVAGAIGRSSQQWDFGQSVDKSYRDFADGQKAIGTVGVMVGGDVSQDGIVNARDRAYSRMDLFRTGYERSDVTLDGTVNAADRTLIRSNTFWVTQVP